MRNLQKGMVASRSSAPLLPHRRLPVLHWVLPIDVGCGGARLWLIAAAAGCHDEAQHCRKFRVTSAWRRTW